MLNHPSAELRQCRRQLDAIQGEGGLLAAERDEKLRLAAANNDLQSMLAAVQRECDALKRELGGVKVLSASDGGLEVGGWCDGQTIILATTTTHFHHCHG